MSLLSLFQRGNFVLASGARSAWKIECDALTREDWAALAVMAAELLPPFREVRGVPRGGLPFAEALAEYVAPDSDHLLIAEDVVTTGGSIERFLKSTEVGSFARVLGVCAFARGAAPDWITPVFTLGKRSSG